MMEQTSPPMARIVAAKVLLDRGWGKPKEMHHSEVDDNKTLLKVVNEIVHVYETREQIEFNDQTPLLDINPSKNGNVRPIIKEIQSSVSSMRGIARALTARGVKTARGGDWSDVQVAAILRR